MFELLLFRSLLWLAILYRTDYPVADRDTPVHVHQDFATVSSRCSQMFTWLVNDAFGYPCTHPTCSCTCTLYFHVTVIIDSYIILKARWYDRINKLQNGAIIIAWSLR